MPKDNILVTGAADVLKKIRVQPVIGDITDRARLREALRGMDLVIHSAR